jgi:Mn2+/Fe2+ NRAMP family transporter
VFLILLANDRELMGRWANSASNNLVAASIVAFITVCGAAYGVDSFLLTAHIIH